VAATQAAQYAGELSIANARFLARLCHLRSVLVLGAGEEFANNSKDAFMI